LLRELILKELSSKEPVVLTKDVIDGASSYIQESIDWCASALNPSLCMEFIGIVNDIISSLSTVRLRKFVNLKDALGNDFAKASADFEVLNRAVSLIRRFMELSLCGLTSGGKVAVRFRELVTLGNREFPRGATVLVDVDNALLLELLGYAEIIGKLS